MKVNITVNILILSVLIISSCSKDVELKTNPNPNPTPSFPSGIINGNKEYFWGRLWQQTSDGQEIFVETWRLTDSAINNGITIYAAIYNDWSSFHPLPLTLNEPGLTDTVNLSYTIIPGKVKVIAKAPFPITWLSDVMIEYR